MAKAYGSLKEPKGEGLKSHSIVNGANLTRRLNVAFFVRIIFIEPCEWCEWCEFKN